MSSDSSSNANLKLGIGPLYVASKEGAIYEEKYGREIKDLGVSDLLVAVIDGGSINLSFCAWLCKECVCAAFGTWRQPGGRLKNLDVNEIRASCRS